LQVEPIASFSRISLLPTTGSCTVDRDKFLDSLSIASARTQAVRDEASAGLAATAGGCAGNGSAARSTLTATGTVKQATRTLAFAGLIALTVLGVTTSSSTGRAATLPSGFQDTTVFSGLTQPTAVRFASDGRIFVAEKSGLVKVFDNLSDTTPTVFADLRTEVYNFWDRGLLGLELDPNFPSTPYLFAISLLGSLRIG